MPSRAAAHSRSRARSRWRNQHEEEETMGRTRELFAAGGRLYKAVPITIDDETNMFYVGKVTVKQRGEFLKLLEGDGGLAKAQAYLVQQACYEDDAGTRAFNDTAEDMAVILSAPMQFIHAISNEIMTFNRLLGEDPVKEAAKN
jgi:hypothetical protein